MSKSICFSRIYRAGLPVLLSSAALLLGGVIYLLFHASEPVFFKWIHASGTGGWLEPVRHNSLSVLANLPGWIVFSLPAGLWAFAYALVITTIWAGSRSRARYFWMASIPLLVIGFEIFQYAGIIHGTFCIQDLTLGLAGMSLGIIAGIFTRPYNHLSAEQRNLNCRQET